jgi:ERCC4-type nuclease
MARWMDRLHAVAVSPERAWQAGWVLAITVDVHERASGVPRMLETLGVQVEVRALTRGDYVVGPGAVVERKTTWDLHTAISKGRFWAQMRKIRSCGPQPYLMVEGRSAYKAHVADNAVRGLLIAVADLGVTIIRTEGPEDSALWLVSLAKRRRDGAPRDRPVYAQRPRSTVTSPAEAALACAPDVSVKTARVVLDRFGSLSNVAQAKVDDLQALPGVGIKRATAIVALIHDQPHSATTL